MARMVPFESRRGMFMLSLTVSISHSFLLALYLRKHFYVCLYNPSTADYFTVR